VREAFRIGYGHGLYCLGCCWALMLLGFAAGVVSIPWMAILTLVIVFEKTGRGGDRKRGVSSKRRGAGAEPDRPWATRRRRFRRWRGVVLSSRRNSLFLLVLGTLFYR
jgi:hypothetical protein